MRIFHRLVITPTLMATLLLALSSISYTATATENTDPTEVAIRQLIDNAGNAFAKEDFEGVLKAFHPQSPQKANTEENLRRIFKTHDVQLTFSDFKFIGEDGNYAVVRMKEKSTRIPSSDGTFNDNTSDVLYVFRKDGKAWKIWNEMILETKFHEAKASQ
jgi:ketosteroid isomerase-like protein